MTKESSFYREVKITCDHNDLKGYFGEEQNEDARKGIHFFLNPFIILYSISIASFFSSTYSNLFAR